ncbi:restriction endonuclease subunit S [Tolumonas auensis]|uniref:restriction endonuclease subunit S n=1 Tax=Tolumonas auensis TaxID=43948 RepID=UPI002AA7D047|nr:restriction endonuclease subunit S [Tolumonas auensis]
MSELPKGWVQCRLGDVLTLINGRAYNKDEMLVDPNSGVPILRIQNLNGGDNWFYSDLDLAEDKYCYKGDLLFAWSATFGPYWARWDKTIYHYHIWLIKPSTLLTKKFAFYVLQNITASIKAAAHGVAMPHMTKNGMENWSIGIPSLIQQTRIVEKLDEVLAQVDTIKARLDSIPTILKRFRQSVLAAAVSGRLTEDEFKPNAFLTLGETGIEIKTGPFGSALHKSDYIEAGISVINPMHINDGFIQPSTQMTITQEKFSSLSAWHLKNGDVVVGRRGEMGRAAVVRNIESRPLLCGTGSMILRGNENINPDYLCFIIRSPVAVSYFNSTSVGSTMVNLNQQVIKKLRVYFPSLSKQKEIVSLVNQYFAFADTIEAQVKKAQARVNNLTQSILAKAFRGELVAQDPSDEPAEKLLERIAQARKEAEALAKAAKKVAKTK